MNFVHQTCPACMGQYKTDGEGRMVWHLHNPGLRDASRQACPGAGHFGIETSTADARRFAREYLKRGGAHAVAAAAINEACDAEGDLTQTLVQLTSDFISSRGWRPRLRHRIVEVRPEERISSIDALMEQNARLSTFQPDRGVRGHACWSLQATDIDGAVALVISGRRSRTAPLKEMRRIDERTANAEKP